MDVRDIELRRLISKHPHDRSSQKGHGNWSRGGATRTTGAPDYTPLEDAKRRRKKTEDKEEPAPKKTPEKAEKKPEEKPPAEKPDGGLPEGVRELTIKRHGEPDVPVLFDPSNAPKQWEDDGSGWTEDFWRYVSGLAESDKEGDMELSLALSQERREVESAFRTEMRRRISMGEEVERYSGFQSDWGYEGPEELPEELWHVTTAVDAVRKEGLKSRSELGQESGKGLGGGSADTISFTSDPDIAAAIKDAMVQRHAILNGKITPQDLIREAKAGTGADRPWYDQKTMSEQALWEIDNSRLTFGGAMTVEKAKEYYKDRWERGIDHSTIRPNPEATPLGRSGNMYVDFIAKRSEQGRLEALGDFHENWLIRRETAGGPIDPLFFSTDESGFSKLDPGQIQIMKFRRRGKSKGYQVSALGEWRAYTGEVVELVE